MKKFFIEQWKALALLAFSALWIGVFPIWSNWLTKPPLNEQISLATAGSVTKVIEVRSLEPLELTFTFDRDGQSFEDLKRPMAEPTHALQAEERPNNSFNRTPPCRSGDSERYRGGAG